MGRAQFPGAQKAHLALNAPMLLCSQKCHGPPASQRGQKSDFPQLYPRHLLLLCTTKKGACPSSYDKYWGITHRMEETIQWLWPKAFYLCSLMSGRSNRPTHLLLIIAITEALRLQKTAKITLPSHQRRPHPTPALSFPHHALCCGTTAILPQRIEP